MWRIRPGIAVHGQVAFDEFNLGKLTTEPGWWKNTYATLVGVQLADIGLRDLDLSLEYTRVRPYTYSNRTPSLAYVHSRGVLGHPAGPNSEDLLLSGRYRTWRSLEIGGRIALTRRGLNTDTQNFGSNPSRPYNVDRVDEAGLPLVDDVRLLQGVRQTEWLIEGSGGLEIWPNAYLELGLRYQSVDNQETSLDRYVNPFLQFRWGLPTASVRY